MLKLVGIQIKYKYLKKLTISEIFYKIVYRYVSFNQ